MGGTMNEETDGRRERIKAALARYEASGKASSYFRLMNRKGRSWGRMRRGKMKLTAYRGRVKSIGR